MHTHHQPNTTFMCNVKNESASPQQRSDRYKQIYTPHALAHSAARTPPPNINCKRLIRSNQMGFCCGMRAVYLLLWVWGKLCYVCTSSNNRLAAACIARTASRTAPQTHTHTHSLAQAHVDGAHNGIDREPSGTEEKKSPAPRYTVRSIRNHSFSVLLLVQAHHSWLRDRQIDSHYRIFGVVSVQFSPFSSVQLCTHQNSEWCYSNWKSIENRNRFWIGCAYSVLYSIQ